MAATSSAFPTEIYERIVEYAYMQLHSQEYITRGACRISSGASTTLRACALTCRAWLRIRRICLYRRLKLTPVSDSGALNHLIATLDASPTLRELVLELEVVWAPRMEQMERDTMCGSHSALSHGDCNSWHSWPVLLAGKLPRLRRVDLMSGSKLPLRHASRAFLRTFNSVVELNLYWHGESSLSEVARWLSSFPQVRCLSLDGTFDDITQEAWQKSPAEPLLPHVRYVSNRRGAVRNPAASAQLLVALTSRIPNLCRP
ncbi:hypothetical protein OH77DRAFT_1131880 [Trametes cingulata]|nr:hypothetical protein OH77DRAFT_1131880 [Trametes cingulata]